MHDISLNALRKIQELLTSFGVLEVNSQHGARHCAAVHLLDATHDHTHVPAKHTHTDMRIRFAAGVNDMLWEGL